MKQINLITTFLVAAILIPSLAPAGLKFVDLNGPVDATHFRSIQAAINAATSNVDTVIVYPGFYNLGSGQLNFNKSVVLMGSGFETTIIASNSNPTVVVSAGATGKIIAFDITSNTGAGITLNSGIISNCLVRGCARQGIFLPSTSTGIVANSIVCYNGGVGIQADNGATAASVYNTISYYNDGAGFAMTNYYGGGSFALNYSDGSQSVNGGFPGVGNTDSPPLFKDLNSHPMDLHLAVGSPCFDKGKPNLYDPDFSRSDMGYFGGPDCPVFPIVKTMTMTINGTNVQIQLIGSANY